MYLEERVEQLKNLSVDHVRQIETVAKGLANLTVTVNQRFDRVEADIAEVKSDVSILKADVTVIKLGQVRLESTMLEMQQTQQVILTLLQERLK